jgi:hypothetical protein
VIRGRKDGHDMQQKWRDKKCIQKFSRKILKKRHNLGNININATVILK